MKNDVMDHENLASFLLSPAIAPAQSTPTRRLAHETRSKGELIIQYALISQQHLNRSEYGIIDDVEGITHQ